MLYTLKFPIVFINWIRSCITTPRFLISINGRLEGYFQGKRGIRQGDQISPYLFVLAINVLSKLLDDVAVHGMFHYHLKCKKIMLTHLCFADDLLIFFKGNLDSMVGIQKVMTTFYKYSRLQLNNAKIELFSSGMVKDDLEEIHKQIGFKLCTLPMRYLGVPLVTRRLLAKDCIPLVDKIALRINCWSTKLLSYAGRLQLIQSVLFSLQIFWCRTFILPKGVLRKVNQMCASFLWKGKENTTK